VRNLVWVLLVLGIGGFGVSQSAAKDAMANAAQQEVTAAVTAWNAAAQKGDTAALRRMIDDDFVGTSFSGTLVYKDDIIPEGGGSTFPESLIEGLQVRVFGDTAVAIGAVIFKGGGPGKVRFTQVWAKRGDGWVMVVAHLSRAQ